MKNGQEERERKSVGRESRNREKKSWVNKKNYHQVLICLCTVHKADSESKVVGQEKGLWLF